MTHRPTLQPLAQTARETLQRLTQQRALYLVARDLGVTHTVLARALACLPIQQASRLLIETRLNELAQHGAEVEGAAA